MPERCPVCRRPMKKGPRSVTLGVAARVMGVSHATVLRAVQAGKVKAWATPGGHHRVVLEDVEKAFGGRR